MLLARIVELKIGFHCIGFITFTRANFLVRGVYRISIQLWSSESLFVSQAILVCFVQLVQVPHKFPIGAGYCFEMTDGQPDLSVRIEDLFVISASSVELSQGKSCLAGVSNLPAVPSHLLMLGPVLLSIFQNLTLINVKQPLFPLKSLPNEPDIELEDLRGSIQGQLRIVQTDMNARTERLIEVSDAVCGKEENSRIIFEYPEEDWREDQPERTQRGRTDSSPYLTPAHS